MLITENDYVVLYCVKVDVFNGFSSVSFTLFCCYVIRKAII